LPPQVQQAEAEEGEQQGIPPQIMAVLQQAQQEIEALQQQLQESQSGIAGKQVDAQAKLEAQRMQSETQLQIAAIQSETQKQIAAMQADQKHAQAEMAGVLQLMAKQLDVKLQGTVYGPPEEPEEPQEPQPDPATVMMAQALQMLAAPKTKRIAIQAPSGQVYTGEIAEGS
jgi:hypothetical protein